jgi:uncharacterized membrane protein YgcG
MRHALKSSTRRARGIGFRLMLLGLLGFALRPSVADERILGFDSAIEIAADGSMQVTETLRVRAEGDQIRRGIYRDFPTRYKDRLGNSYRVGFDVQGVRRDGQPEPWFTQAQRNGVRLYVGDADTFLRPGEYEYELRYTTSFQLGFFGDHDELYWNVTGNGWIFPIDGVSAEVRLPAAVDTNRLSMEGYVGSAGSVERSYTAEILAGGRATIRATRPLGPGEGLTLVMTWPKGVVSEPSTIDRFARLLEDNIGLLIALSALVATTFYLVRIWQARGRDPTPGVIFPHYEPPARISPASARHVTRMGYDQKTFSAAIINLAVKGYLEIDESGGDYSLRATRADAQTRRQSGPLAPGEQALLGALFADDDVLALDNANHRRLSKARAAHAKALERDNYRIYFVTNRVFILPAIAIVAAAFLALLLLNAWSPLAIAVLVGTVLLVPLFAWLLKAPTAVGRRLLDKLEGFKLYLDVAEKDELNLRNPPEKTPELFETFLPYAFALGVEQRWAEKFNGVFGRIRAETGRVYQPVWYHGHWDAGRLGNNVSGMTTNMTHAVGSAIAAAATPPGSSSGSGGGGSSGGGGGGGGGGGW